MNSFELEQSSNTPLWRHFSLSVALILIGLAVFFLMLLSISTQGLFYTYDQPILDFFLGLQQRSPAWLVQAAKVIGQIGSQGVLAVGVALAAWWLWKRDWRWLSLLLASAGVVELIWLALIFVIDRPRPQPVTAFGGVSLPSFPSGHTLMAATFWTLVVYLVYPRLRSNAARLAFGLGVLLWVILTGLIRLYVGAHYPTDVIAGYGLGLAWGVFAILLMEWYWEGRQEQDDG